MAPIASTMRLPATLVNNFMDMFQRTRLVPALADEETFVLGRDPETISFKDILDCVRNSGTKSRVPSRLSVEEQEVERRVDPIDQSATRHLNARPCKA